MKYVPPKTRIKIIKKVNGNVMYQPQYEMFFFCWADILLDLSLPRAICGDIKSAQKRIDKFLVRCEECYKQDVGGKVASVEYVKYP